MVQSKYLDADALPIVGGKGLRQWQIAQRKAFLNGWSMVDRLSHLETENAQLRKENDLLRKVFFRFGSCFVVCVVGVCVAGLGWVGGVTRWYRRQAFLFLSILSLLVLVAVRALDFHAVTRSPGGWLMLSMLAIVFFFFRFFD